MNPKNLPIKLFKKRDEIDDRRTEGGGGKDLPSWVLNDKELAERRSELLTSLQLTKNILSSRQSQANFVPAVLKVTLQSQALAKTHRNQVGKIFNNNRKFNFIGMSDECDLLVKVEDFMDLTVIEKGISSDDNKHGISAIEKIEPYKPFIQANDDILKVKLLNFQNYNLNKTIETVFENNLKRENILFSKTRYATELTIYRLSYVATDAIQNIENFEGLYSITGMPRVSVTMDSFDSTVDIPIKHPKKGEEYPVVGILDSGIASIPHLAPWLVEKSFSKYPESVINTSHGTFVAGVLLYGDELQGKNWTGLDGCKLFNAIVFPDPKKETIYEDELVQNIKEAIEQNDDIKIWNLSLGMSEDCDDNDFSDFGKTLDFLQDKHNVLICKSAGNCDNFKISKPVRKIPKSADSVRSIVVGSLAHEKNINDIAEIDWPSPFSRIGFGPNNLIKPDLTHYGGNTGIDAAGRLSITGVNSFSNDGGNACNVGTSFSTPRITSILTGLNHNISEPFNPLLLKALTIHSAKYPAAVTLNSVEKIKNLGYGIPSHIEDILFNAPNEITLILQDSLVKGNYYEILDFPYPKDMIHNGIYYGDIIVTMVSSPLLDNHNALEYCQSNIDLKFGTYDNVKDRDITKPTILNEHGPDGAINLLSARHYSRRILNNTEGEYANERLLRNYGDKFHPVKKYSIKLDDLTPANVQKALISPKQWFLRLEGLYSAFAEAQANLDGTILNQEFCVVITIRDTRNNTNVYNAVTRQLDTHNFIHQNIQLRNSIQVRIGEQ